MQKRKEQEIKKDDPLLSSKDLIEFRLLYHNRAFGGLIGSNGNIIKSLEHSTSSKIYANVSNPSISHRIVHIIASLSLTRTLTLNGVTTRVSLAQEALIRVFDRVIESEQEYLGTRDDKYVKCGVVVKQGMVGAVMGEGGSRINKVVNLTKAYVKILPIDFPPPGVDFGDELVQVTGRPLCVKKALVMISQYLQQKAIDLEQQLSNSVVVFKLICDDNSAGWVLGSKGKRVKSMEDETGATIRFSPADAAGVDRLITISAFENKESQNSLAQNATVRVFNEIAKWEDGNTVSARLLILPYQSDWLTGGEVSIISTIHNASGATLKIMELNDSVVSATADEKVLQIDGDYPDVQIALFQVTWALRERVFDALLPKDSSPLLPHKLFNLPSEGSKMSALINKMNKCRVSKESEGPPPPINSHSQFSAASSSTPGSGSSGDSETANGNSSFCSGNTTFVVTNKILEIAVREDVFAAVYGENDSNLSRMRMISGARVEVHDPISGSDGKVIISGTSEQTLVAQSLLQAFLMSA